MQYNNAMTGALFATNDAKVLSGIFSVDGENKLALTAHLGGEGEAHELVLQKRNKDGVPVGKPITTGSFKRLDKPLGPFVSPSGNTSYLVARGTLRGKKGDTKIVVFRIERDNDSAFFQVKRDEMPVRELPPL